MVRSHGIRAQCGIRIVAKSTRKFPTTLPMAFGFHTTITDLLRVSLQAGCIGSEYGPRLGAGQCNLRGRIIIGELADSVNVVVIEK